MLGIAENSWNGITLGLVRAFGTYHGSFDAARASDRRYSCVDHSHDTIYTGGYTTQEVCHHIPAYWYLAMRMEIPFILPYVKRRKPGCDARLV